MTGGHIEKRVNRDGSVSWRVVVRVGFGRGARRETRTVAWTETDRKTPPKKATDALRELERQAEAGFVPPARYMVADLLDDWLGKHVDVKLATKTAYTYRRIVETHLKPAFVQYRVQDVRPSSMQDYYALKREEGLSGNAIHYHYRTMHAALAWGVGSELVARNVCDVKAAKPLRVKPPEMQTVSAAQMLGLLESVAGTELELPVLLAVATGMRRGEVLGLRWGDVDLAAGTVRVRSSLSAVPGHELELKATKTGRERTVALPEFAVAALKRARQAPDARVVPDLHPDKLTKLWREKAAELKLGGVRFHDLRHSYATMLLQGGAEITAVQEALGHTLPSTTLNIYLHTTEQMRERRRELVEAAFAVEAEKLGEDAVVEMPRNS